MTNLHVLNGQTTRWRNSLVCFLTYLLAAVCCQTAFAATATVFSSCAQLAGGVNGLAATQNKLLFTVQTDSTKVYQVDSTGTTCTVFATLPAAALPAGRVEMYLAVSPGLAGFTQGDIFVTQFENVYRIPAAGGTVTTPFVTIPALSNHNQIHSGITFDTSAAYGNKLIVTGQNSNTGNGVVYTVDSSKNVSLLATLPAGITEGPGVTSSAFTPPNTLLVTQENANLVWQITPGGVATQFDPVHSYPDIAGVDVIPTQLCSLGSSSAFFTTNFAQNQILQYPASDFTPGGGVLFPVEFTVAGKSILLTDNTGTQTIFDPNGGTVVHEGSTFVSCTSLQGCTVTQGGWGAAPHGNNPGMLLLQNFSKVYPGGSVVIGGTNKLTFTSAGAIQAFLPQGGPPGILSASLTNPTSSSAGVFAGQVLALQLNVDFSAAGVTTLGLGNFILKGTGTSLDGFTISQILAIANQVLGGNLGALPAGFSVSSLNDLVDTLNQAFDGCVVSTWAMQHLS